MAQYACTELKKREILIAMFIAMFIGLLLGINQSITSLGQAIPPVIAGVITSININLPIAVGAVATLLAWAMFIVLCVRNKACVEVTAPR